MSGALVRSASKERGWNALAPWLCALLLGLSTRAHALQQEPPIATEKGSGIEIRLGLPLREQPNSGFFPVHLQISNDTNSAHTWDLEFSSGNVTPAVRSRTHVSVGAHQGREFDLLIPWPGLDSTRPGYQMISGEFTGYGVVHNKFQLESRYGSGSGAATIAIADPLGSSVWGALETKLKEPNHALPPVSPGLSATRFDGLARTSGRQSRGSPVRLDELPPDARALSGIAALWVGETEWHGLLGSRRTAIRQWVEDGGRLFVASAGAPPMPGLPGLANDPVALGLGEICRVSLSSPTLPIEETAERVLDLDRVPIPPWEQDFSEQWPLRSAVGEPKLNVPLLILFVCAFGILVGPVNLLWFAPESRRYRLFFTVPLLSIGASGLLLALIALGDGVGGDGARNVLLYVPAGENRLALFQEQMVRTRLLFQRSFELPETVAASFLAQDVSADNARRNGPLELVRDGPKLSGDWFRARAVQGMFLRTSIPSRGEVVLRPGAVPELLSTLASPLHHVHFLDAENKFWTADELTTGRPVRLKRESAEDFDRWSNSVLAPLSFSLRAQFQAALGRPGYFYAEANPTDENTIPTLKSIGWREQHILCLGFTTAEATP